MNTKLLLIVGSTLLAGSSANAQLAVNSKECLDRYSKSYTEISNFFKAGEIAASVPSNLVRRDEYKPTTESSGSSLLQAPSGAVQLNYYAFQSTFYRVVGAKKFRAGSISGYDIDDPGRYNWGSLQIGVTEEKSNYVINVWESRDNGCGNSGVSKYRGSSIYLKDSSVKSYVDIYGRSTTSSCLVDFDLLKNCYSYSNYDKNENAVCSSDRAAFIGKAKATLAKCQ